MPYDRLDPYVDIISILLVDGFGPVDPEVWPRGVVLLWDESDCLTPRVIELDLVLSFDVNPWTDAGAMIQISLEDNDSSKSKFCWVDWSIWMTDGRPGKLSLKRVSRRPIGLIRSRYCLRCSLAMSTYGTGTSKYAFWSKPPFTTSQHALGSSLCLKTVVAHALVLDLSIIEPSSKVSIRIMSRLISVGNNGSDLRDLAYISCISK